MSRQRGGTPAPDATAGLAGKRFREAAIDKSHNDIIAEFKRRRTRQTTAIAVSVVLLAALLWKMGHPGFLLGELSKSTVMILEIVVIAGFVLFSTRNWRCPACGCFLGSDIDRRECRKCGTQLL